MIIDLSGLLKDIGGVMSISDNIKLSDTEFLGENFRFAKGLDIEGKITNNSKSLHFTARVRGNVTVHCARCTKEFEKPVDFELSEFLVREEQNMAVDGEDDAVVFSDEKIEIDDLIINNFLMNESGKYLCREDCKGLCSVCGKDLNLGECNCTKDEIDPRWAGLAEIMKNS